jgi:hypothetical protein
LNKQREKPEGVAAIERFKAAVPAASAPGAKVSGAQFENFRRGWAHPGMLASPSGCAHYFKRYGFDRAMAACGLVVDVRWLFGQGSYPRCKRCQRSSAAAMAQCP